MIFENHSSNAKQAKGNRGGLLLALYVAVTMLTALGSIVATISWLARSKASSGTVLWFWGATILLVAVIPRLFPKPSPDDIKRFEAERAILSEFPDFVLSLRKAA